MEGAIKKLNSIAGRGPCSPEKKNTHLSPFKNSSNSPAKNSHNEAKMEPSCLVVDNFDKKLPKMTLENLMF